MRNQIHNNCYYQHHTLPRHLLLNYIRANFSVTYYTSIVFFRTSYSNFAAPSSASTLWTVTNRKWFALEQRKKKITKMENIKTNYLLMQFLCLLYSVYVDACICSIIFYVFYYVINFKNIFPLLFFILIVY